MDDGHSNITPGSRCWFCLKQPDTLCNANIDLNLNPFAPGVSDNKRDSDGISEREERLAWQALKNEFGDLSVMEEALVSCVVSC